MNRTRLGKASERVNAGDDKASCRGGRIERAVRRSLIAFVYFEGAVNERGTKARSPQSDTAILRSANPVAETVGAWCGYLAVD
jgi:hypothetical protein